MLLECYNNALLFALRLQPTNLGKGRWEGRRKVWEKGGRITRGKIEECDGMIATERSKEAKHG
jgi:hypothetical protein